MAGPFEFESKPLTISADGKLPVMAASSKGGCGAGMPLDTKPLFATACVEGDSELASGEIEASTTASGKGSWRTISLAIGLATGAGGLAVYRRISAI